MTVTGSGDQAATRLVHIIVTCTNRKSRTIAEHLRLADVPAGTSAARCRDWVRRLSCQPADQGLSAVDLYAGEHWAIARNLPALVHGNEHARLWACSAGYGLIPADARIHPYAATFATGHPDSVLGDTADWWQFLAAWEGPDRGQPRSIRGLAEINPDALFLILLSAPYALACQEDIADAAELLRNPGELVLVSAGARPSRLLEPVTMPADARLQSCLGGTLQSLNVRIGERLLTAGIRRRDEAARYLAALLNTQPPRPNYDRTKLDDSEVMARIAGGLARSPGASASQLLREFRHAGYACEQGRFAELYKRVTEVAT